MKKSIIQFYRVTINISCCLVEDNLRNMFDEANFELEPERFQKVAYNYIAAEIGKFFDPTPVIFNINPHKTIKSHMIFRIGDKPVTIFQDEEKEPRVTFYVMLASNSSIEDIGNIYDLFDKIDIEVCKHMKIKEIIPKSRIQKLFEHKAKIVEVPPKPSGIAMFEMRVQKINSSEDSVFLTRLRSLN